jgi:hypothetical protein
VWSGVEWSGGGCGAVGSVMMVTIVAMNGNGDDF